MSERAVLGIGYGLALIQAVYLSKVKKRNFRVMEKYNQSIVIHPLFHLAATSSELPNLKAAFFGRSQ